ncbi:glycosyltransferase involved in cell wall biosynthesis [Ochrobactrum sp. P20RRXII]|nr:glycosyltransferase family 2 protein [Ochrobactrum sp. P20RRXII]NIH77293.1 glycosyltransferase involved in cell wall biosynthesis [Ochrobactrum sp. P20RRXII]
MSNLILKLLKRFPDMNERSGKMNSVSVIIPYYNQGKYLQSAVQSALSSYEGDIEVLVVNDGSTEGHAKHYCNQAQKLDPRVRIIHKDNGGLSSARNAGIREAKGTYIQLLDCDDVLLPGKIQRQVDQLQYSRDKLVSVCGYYIANEWLRNLRDETHSINRFPFTVESFLFQWERGFSIPIHCGLFHRSVFDDLFFEEKLYGKEDWLFWSILAGRQRNAFIYCPFIGVIYRLHESGMTRSLDKMGESWVEASRILDKLYAPQFPSFAKASNDWHLNFYKGSRLSSEEKSRLHAKSSNSGRNEKQQRQDGRLHPTVTLKKESGAVSDNVPLISFVVPVFNHQAYLKQCIESLINQKTTIPFEIIVVDDRSTQAGVIDTLCAIDSGPIVLKVFQNDENYGISLTQNLAVQQCSGEYIAFVDCDDYVLDTAVDDISQVIAETSADYIFTDKNHMDESGRFTSRFDYGGYPWITPSGSIEDDILLGMVASHLKVIRRKLYLELGGSDDNYSGVQDWDLALRTIGEGKFHYLNKALYNHRIHKNSVTSSGSVTQFWMTNVLRRKYLEKFSTDAEVSAMVEINRINTDSIRYISERFKEGVRYTFRTNEPSLSDDQVDMLREFNTYFDRIFVSAGDAASLMGYLWDHKIVRRF